VEDERSAGGPSPARRVPRSWWKAAAAAGILIVIAVAVPALHWQYEESTRVRCQSNMRRLGTALLLYAQDHDGRLPPPQFRTATGEWRHWLDSISYLISPDEISVCPVNGAKGAVQPLLGFPFPHSYALNERFYDVFSAGPFPTENLELPAQTVMLAESGGFHGQAPGKGAGFWSMNVYTDTARWPAAYPSPHSGKMNIAAADGHVVSLKIAHYRPEGHDSFYGRLGGSIFNWNGGHPNGDTSGPPRE
jgi:prepilin-type processing-associated H-X9-DG protein